jgi:hypothetical protein
LSCKTFTDITNKFRIQKNNVVLKIILKIYLV